MKDPVCGMDVDSKTTEHQYRHDGQGYFFCSPHCLEKFRTEPTRYIALLVQAGSGQTRTEDPSTGKGAIYTCPMDPEIRESKPGACPKCGMALEPMTITPSSTKTEYTCPMHPEIVQQEPGSCPICGMALEPRTVTAEEETNPELVDMTRRFWTSVVLSVPVLFLAMSEAIPGQPVQRAQPL